MPASNSTFHACQRCDRASSALVPVQALPPRYSAPEGRQMRGLACALFPPCTYPLRGAAGRLRLSRAVVRPLAGLCLAGPHRRSGHTHYPGNVLVSLVLASPLHPSIREVTSSGMPAFPRSKAKTGAPPPPYGHGCQGAGSAFGSPENIKP